MAALCKVQVTVSIKTASVDKLGKQALGQRLVVRAWGSQCGLAVQTAQRSPDVNHIHPSLLGGKQVMHLSL